MTLELGRVKKIISWYLENNYNIVQLPYISIDGSKAFTLIENQTVENILNIISQPHEPGLGIILKEDQIVIDIDEHDPKKSGHKSLFQLLHDLNITISWLTNYPSVMTGRNGRHIYCQAPENKKIKSEFLKKYPGIDILQKGHLVIIPPTIHPETKKQYDWPVFIGSKAYSTPTKKPPSYIVDAIFDPINVDQAYQIRTDEKITPEQLQEILSGLPVEKYAANHLWEPILFAAHKATNGEGFDVFLQWSTSDPKYQNDQNIIRARWFSIKNNINSPITIGTLIDEYKKHNNKLPEYKKDLIKQTNLDSIKKKLENTHISEDQSSILNGLVFNKNGTLKLTESNLTIIIKNHCVFKDLIGFNTRNRITYLMKPAPFISKKTPIEFTMSEAYTIAEWFQKTFQISPNGKTIFDIISNLSLDPQLSYHFDPFKDWLETLQWDGQSRLQNLLSYTCDISENTSLLQSFSKNLLLTAVARTYRPGCKVDNMIILTGPQGIGKSTFFKSLLPDETYFSDHMPAIKDKDAKMQIHGLVYLEIAELEAFNKSETSAIKSFLTATVDRYRPPYGRAVIDCPRTCVFVGSTNPNIFLKDTTGNRRFWPVEVEKTINVDYVIQNRDQLWAEAVYLYKQGEVWYLDQAQSQQLIELNKKHEEEIPWFDTIANYVQQPIEFVQNKQNRQLIHSPDINDLDIENRFVNKQRQYITTTEILLLAINIPQSQITTGKQRLVAQILKLLNWTIKWIVVDNRRCRAYTPPKNFKSNVYTLDIEKDNEAQKSKWN